jgi:hypothetical protein
VSRVFPNGRLDVLLVRDRVVFRVFNVGPVLSNGFVIAFVGRISYLKGTICWRLFAWNYFLNK